MPQKPAGSAIHSTQWTDSVEPVNKKPHKRDAVRSKKSILDAALIEFSQYGYAGARIDRIARRAGISKPMLYEYFGDKDALYAAALRRAYIQIRVGESKLNLGEMDPESAIRALVFFTLRHFQTNPWFVSMLNTENLRGGETIRKIQDATEIQSTLVVKLGEVLSRGVSEGVFRDGIDSVDCYIFIASLCYFPISNIHTLRAVFNCPIDEEWLEQRGKDAGEMIVRFLHHDPTESNPDA